MNFTTVKAITIPDGNVVKNTSNGVVLWKKISFLPHTNLVPTAKNADGSILDGIGYRRKNTLLSSGSVFAMAASDICTAVGMMTLKNGTTVHDIYIYGLDFTGVVGNKYLVFGSTYNMLSSATYLKVGGTSAVHSALTQLGDHYYKFTTKAYSEKVKYFALAATTVNGMEPIITVDQPILG